MQLNPSRNRNESFKAYKARRAAENAMVYQHLRIGRGICLHTLRSTTNPKTNLAEFFLQPNQYQPYKNNKKVKTNGRERKRLREIAERCANFD